MDAEEFTKWAISINDGIVQDKDPMEKTFGAQKAILKPIEVEYLQWHDNLSEMKRFCQDDCLAHMWVAIGYYVVKLPNGFTVVNDIDFKEYFDNTNLN